MQIENIGNSQITDIHFQPQPWCKPELLDYGSVGDLTQGGADAGPEDAYFSS